ncbi:MAG: TRAP transporter small permease [Chloroflexi bacterium]|nr:TRAP transporter small permease [Chloroflexota bacterium]
MSLVTKIVDKIITASVAIPTIALVGGTFLILAYVIGRRWLGLQWLFVEEYIGYFLVLFTYFPLAYTLKTGGHIRVTAAIGRLPAKARASLDVATSVIALGVLGFMMRATIADWWLPAWTRHTISNTAANTPLWIPYLILPLGLGLFAVVVALHIASVSRALAKKEVMKEAGEAEVEGL